MDPTTIYVVVGIAAAVAIASGWTARDIVRALVSRIRSRGGRLEGPVSQPTAPSVPAESAELAKPELGTTGLAGGKTGALLDSLLFQQHTVVWLSIEPTEVEPGGKVALRDRFRSATSTMTSLFSSRECEVRTPDGRSLVRHWSDDVPALVFPDDFPYGSTELLGTYSVTVRERQSSPYSLTAGEDKEAVGRASFIVRSSENSDD